MPKNKYKLPEVEDELKRRILNILRQRIGPDMAIKRRDILYYLGFIGPDGEVKGDRKLRLAIAELQMDGVLILSGADGYYLASEYNDVMGFCAREIDSRIAKLSRKKSKMLDAARKVYGGQVRMEV